VQVSIRLVSALIAAVERAGGRREHFLALARIDPELVLRGDARLSVEEYIAVLEAALEATPDPALGLHLGEHARSSMYHVVAHLVEHAKTLGEGVDMILRYSSLLASGFEPRLIEYPDRVALRLPYLCGESGAVRLTAEFAMAGLMRMLRQFLGEGVRPLRVCFAYRQPAHHSEYRRVFGGLECFGQPYTELQFPREWLARSQLYANPELHILLQTHAERELAQLERGGSVRERVERVLAMSDPRTLPSMQDVARELDISARTLARKLQLEDASFAQLIEDRRMRAAKSLLQTGRLTIQEVADAMGFADAPAFYRAFRRWTGLTPKQYVATVFR